MRAPHCSHWQLNDGVHGMLASSTRWQMSISCDRKFGMLAGYTPVISVAIQNYAGTKKLAVVLSPQVSF
jgi:hypothetical protein